MSLVSWISIAVAACCVLITAHSLYRVHIARKAVLRAQALTIARVKLLQGELAGYRLVLRNIAGDAGMTLPDLMLGFDTSAPDAFVLQPTALRRLLVRWLEHRSYHDAPESAAAQQLVRYLARSVQRLT